MKKLAVLYPAHYEQSSGGAEIQIRYLMEACVRAGIEVHYIFVNKGTEIKNELRAILYPLNKKRKYKFCGQGWFLYKKQIVEVLDKINPDVIYTRLGSSWINIASEYALKHRIKHIHALASDKDVARKILLPPFFPLFSQIEIFHINKGLRNSTTIIAQNCYQQNKILSRFHKDAILVNQMTSTVKEHDIIKSMDKIRIVWIGNFKEVKRPELFIQLANKLSAFQNQVELIMCGRMSEKHKSLLGEINNVDILEYKGELSQNEVFDLLLTSHILVNTSIYEGFSNTFVQAWMRKVVVVSMNSNPNEILTTQDMGYVTPTFDSLLDTITSMISHPEIIVSKAEKSYIYALKEHCIENNMNKIIRLI